MDTLIEKHSEYLGIDLGFFKLFFLFLIFIVLGRGVWWHFQIHQIY
jgi:hypothetical protein